MKKNGFTLIELLAVILILGIIALIAVPTVNGVIEESRIGAKETSGDSLVSTTSNFCISEKLNKKDPYNNVLNYESEEYPTVESLIGIKGDVPSYDNFLQYELTDGCEVKVIYETDGYRCSNQLDSDGNVTYIVSNSNKTADEVTCEKNNLSIFVNQTNNLPTDGTKHVLKSYSDGSSVINTDFRSDTYRTTIYEIEFTNHIDVPESVSDDMKWDVSEAQDGSIIAWLESIKDTSYNKLYIGSTGSIYANSNSSSLFSKMDNVTKITFGNFNTSNVIDISNMFAYDYSLNDLDVSNFDVSNVTDFSYMFYECILLKSLDISNFKNAKPVNISHMFAASFDDETEEGDYMLLEEIKGIGDLNTSNVTDMSDVFRGNEYIYKLNISKWDTSNVINMSGLFASTGLLNLDLSNFDTSNVTNMSKMFMGAFNLTNLDISNFNTSNVTDMSYMLSCMWALEKINISGFDTSNVTNMKGMFDGDVELINLDVSMFNTSNVTDMNFMFDSLLKLQSLDVSNFNTSKVTNMARMFYNCESLTSLDVSSFDTSNVIDMSWMFYWNYNLTTIYVSNKFVTDNVNDGDYMFYSCTKLKGAISYDSSKTDATMANYTTGYFTLKES